MAEEKKKLCPMLNERDCRKENCEWWAKRMGGINIEACSIRVLAENLFFIQECLKRVEHD